MENNEIVLFESRDGAVTLPVKVDSETVWLTQAQIAQLFGKDRTVIGRHIRNAISDGEIVPETMCAKIAHLADNASGSVKIEIYNLEVIIAVGYRVHSQRGVEFRRWATSVLREYLVKGCAINRDRMRQLGQTVEVMKRVANSLDVEQVLDVVNAYSTALDLLDGYDHQTIGKPKVKGRSVELSYEECRRFIDSMKFAADSPLFGNEKDGSFKSALGAVYQSFGGKDLYPSSQEKAANLLYLVTKNHGFSDGNKRIAAGLFLYFLKRNKLLLRKDGSKRIADHTLVALTVMIAESKPQEKELMVNLVMTFLK
jgi:prophage maintenance system killer protein